MKLYFLVMLGAALGFAQTAPPPKIALVNIEEVMVNTPEGQQAEKELDDRFSPRKAKIEDEQEAIAKLQSQIEHQSLTDEAKQRLQGEIDAKVVAVNKETDQADAELDAAQKKVLSALGPRIIAQITAYATAHGYAMVFDISSSDAPRLYAQNATDITDDVIKTWPKRR
ncbi:MAG TPA: OmpH family outer membrane protein [Candidatus Limnocylindrales bacterium]|nr:OmpH family outer membrane protein [Candidatus Limnocylindrales bacterium]